MNSLLTNSQQQYEVLRILTAIGKGLSLMSLTWMLTDIFPITDAQARQLLVSMMDANMITRPSAANRFISVKWNLPEAPNSAADPTEQASDNMKWFKSLWK